MDNLVKKGTDETEHKDIHKTVYDLIKNKENYFHQFLILISSLSDILDELINNLFCS